MTERPSAILGILIATTTAVGALLASGLISLGGTGLLSLAATVVGIVSMCVFFLAGAHRIPVSSLLLVAIVAASLVAFLRAVLAYRREQRLLRRLPLAPLAPGRLARLAAEAGTTVYLSPANRPAAFCFGLLRPKIVLTAGLLARLDEDEQTAALLHEIQHARVREPLRCLLARCAVSALFWLPALRDLFERYVLVKEVAADRYAAARTSSAALAGALCAVAGQTSPTGAIGLGELADARVVRLLEPGSRLPRLFRVRRLLISAGVAPLLALPAISPARIDLSQTASLRGMLLSPSVHGLPGMAAGSLCNLAILAALFGLARRLGRNGPLRAYGSRAS